MQPKDSTEQSTPQVSESSNSSPVQSTQVHTKQKSSPLAVLQKITAWVMITSAILFALIGVMAVWEVFGPDTDDVIWRALSSLAIIAFASLIINVSLRMVDDRRK